MGCCLSFFNSDDESPPLETQDNSHTASTASTVSALASVSASESVLASPSASAFASVASVASASSSASESVLASPSASAFASVASASSSAFASESVTATATATATVTAIATATATASEFEPASVFAFGSTFSSDSESESESVSESAFTFASVSNSESASASAFVSAFASASIPVSVPAASAAASTPKVVEFSIGELAPFSYISFSVLKIATKNFSSNNIISENREDTEDIIYKGRLKNQQWIAIKKFKKNTWTDTMEFAEEAHRIGKLRHKRLTNLIGYCCKGDERFLIAEFMPRNTLSKHLFHWKNHAMEWAMRLRVAYNIAEALDYCSTQGSPLYKDLNASRVMFDENGDPHLSCFGLMIKRNDEYPRREMETPERVIYSFGVILLEMLSANIIDPSHAYTMISSNQILQLLDMNLLGQITVEDSNAVFELASQCLKCESKERPDTKHLVATLAALQTETEVKLKQSPMEEACLRMDLKAIHEILVTAEYIYDKGVTELSFQELIPAMEGIQNIRIHGDQAFVEKDFNTAIDCYSQFTMARNTVSTTVSLRRMLCYLFLDQLDNVVEDAKEAEVVNPEGPMAYYLHSVALSKLGKKRESDDMLKEAVFLEEKRSEIAMENN